MCGNGFWVNGWWRHGGLGLEEGIARGSLSLSETATSKALLMDLVF